MDPYQRPTRLQHNAQQTLHSTQCRFTAGPPSLTLAINHSTLDSASRWRWCVHRVQADTDPMSVKCWASVAGAGHISGSTEVPTLDHEKKEDISEGRKNCSRQCTSHADSPRTPPVHTRIISPPPPPQEMLKKCNVFYCILKSFVDISFFD